MLNTSLCIAARCITIVLALVPAFAFSQEITSRRVVNVSFTSLSAHQLWANTGRLVWRESDPNTPFENLKYFSGAETFLLDSNLTGGYSDIDGDYVVWSTGSGQIKMFNTRTWDTTWLGVCYDQFVQPLYVSGGIVVYAREKAGTGSEIFVHAADGTRDTILEAGVWNSEPSIRHGQVAWTSGASPTFGAPSDIYFFDGFTAKNISNTSGVHNYAPIVFDAQVVWLQDSSGYRAVKLWTRDTVVTLAGAETPSEIVLGAGGSDGTAVVSLADTVTHISRIVIYDYETEVFHSIVDSNLISAARIDNGIVVWRSGSGPGKSIKYMTVSSGVIESLGSGDNPVVDDGVVAWTLGDAVEYSDVVTYEKLTSDLRNGWEQSRFKPIDRDLITYGNYSNSQHTRLFYSDSTQTTQVADSASSNDFVMADDGVMIWRENSDTLWTFDGTGARVKLLDSLQVENMFISKGYISFNGFRLTGGNSILQAWLYNIAGRSLEQMTYEDTSATKTNIVLCDGHSAVWNRDSSDHFMMMYFDGSSVRKISTNDSAMFTFGYSNGVAVWSQIIGGVEQIMMYNTAGNTTTQITHGSAPSTKPFTDGTTVGWYGDLTTTPILYYYNIPTGLLTKVAHAAPQNFRWQAMSNGKTTWSSGGDVYAFDGRSICQITANGDFPPDKESYIDNDYLVWNAVDASSFITMGNIYRGKLQAHPSFTATNISGAVPLNVHFHNTSWGAFQTFTWDFGDGTSSNEEHPSHLYTSPGLYSVTLTVDGPAGPASVRKASFVTARTLIGVEEPKGRRPSGYALYQNFPNPFNPSTTIRFSLPTAGFVSLKVYDILGKVVATIVSGDLTAGEHARTWDARGAPSGVYTYRLRSGNYSEERRMVVVK